MRGKIKHVFVCEIKQLVQVMLLQVAAVASAVAVNMLALQFFFLLLLMSKKSAKNSRFLRKKLGVKNLFAFFQIVSS